MGSGCIGNRSKQELNGATSEQGDPSRVEICQEQGVDGDSIGAGALLGYNPVRTRSRRLSKVGVVNAPKSAEPRQIDPPIRESLPAFHGSSGKNMKTFRFSLVLSGVAEITPALSDALYEATGGDIELSLRDGVALLEFERMASSLKQAIESAI